MLFHLGALTLNLLEFCSFLICFDERGLFSFALNKIINVL